MICKLKKSRHNYKKETTHLYLYFCVRRAGKYIIKSPCMYVAYMTYVCTNLRCINTVFEYRTPLSLGIFWALHAL